MIKHDVLGLEIIGVLAKGKHGIVYDAKYKNKICVVKMAREDSPSRDCIIKEKQFLQKLNKYKIGPEVYFANNNLLVMEKIIGDIIFNIDLHSHKYIIVSILNQCFKMDKLGISKFEMTNPYKHIFINKRKVTMIDFERCIYTEKPKNVTQFCEYLRRRGFNIDKNVLVEYKNKIDISNFKEIKNMILKK